MLIKLKIIFDLNVFVSTRCSVQFAVRILKTKSNQIEQHYVTTHSLNSHLTQIQSHYSIQFIILGF